MEGRNNGVEIESQFSLLEYKKIVAPHISSYHIQNKYPKGPCA